MSAPQQEAPAGHKKFVRVQSFAPNFPARKAWERAYTRHPDGPCARPRYRSEVTLYSPLKLGASNGRKRRRSWTKEHDEYAAMVGVLWIATTNDNLGNTPSPNRAELCVQLANEFKCTPEIVLRQCPWLNCREDYWRADKYARLVSPAADHPPPTLSYGPKNHQAWPPPGEPPQSARAASPRHHPAPRPAESTTDTTTTTTTTTPPPPPAARSNKESLADDLAEFGDIHDQDGAEETVADFDIFLSDDILHLAPDGVLP